MTDFESMPQPRTLTPEDPPIGCENPGIEEMAGQMVVAGFAGTAGPPGDLAALLERRFLGGVILFARNVQDPAQVRALSDAVRAAAPALLPPIVCVDQEGGRVRRIKAPMTELPPARALGLADDPGLAYKWGKVLGAELREVGVNLNLAPVMDVATNAQSPVIGDRALSSDPETVSRLGMSIALGMQQLGVAACAKHFPGHGDTKVDSHEDMPVLELNQRRLKRVELAPFKRSVTGGMAAIMAGHIKVPNLDPDLPASLSKRMIGGIIRDTWGYDGLVVTDDLEMGAIERHFSLDRAVELGLEAGVDLFLICKEPGKAAAALDRITAFGRQSDDNAARLLASYRRILEFKRAYRFSGEPFAPSVLGQEPHRRLVEVVLEKARAAATR